jgi:hypothetical protein
MARQAAGSIIIFTVVFAIAFAMEWLVANHRVVSDTTSGALHRGRRMVVRVDPPKIPGITPSRSEAPPGRRSLVLQAGAVEKMRLSSNQLTRLHSILDESDAEVDQEFVSRLKSKSSSPPTTKTELIAQRALDVLTDKQKRVMRQLIAGG